MPSIGLPPLKSTSITKQHRPLPHTQCQVTNPSILPGTLGDRKGHFSLLQDSKQDGHFHQSEMLETGSYVLHCKNLRLKTEWRQCLASGTIKTTLIFKTTGIMNYLNTAAILSKEPRGSNMILPAENLSHIAASSERESWQLVDRNHGILIGLMRKTCWITLCVWKITRALLVFVVLSKYFRSFSYLPARKLRLTQWKDDTSMWSFFVANVTSLPCCLGVLISKPWLCVIRIMFFF